MWRHPTHLLILEVIYGKISIVDSTWLVKRLFDPVASSRVFEYGRKTCSSVAQYGSDQ